MKQPVGDDAYQDLTEPIAVIGTGCRLPGRASTLEGFHDMLMNARRIDSEVPEARFNANKWFHPSNDRKGAVNNTRGFFLEEDVSLFDAPFFSITAKEAAAMDPAQRLLLEVSYEAFENAGVPMKDVAGTMTSVYAGCMTNDYELLSTHDPYDMGHNAASGNGRTMLANRVSWSFDLRGPSMHLDTACSSSLTALHLACQSLRVGESKQALVLGANLILYPNFPSRLTNMHMLSKDGVSHSFDARANGYGRGEGIGAVVVKPLKQAIQDGDCIRAVIRGTGSNTDGKTQGITQPSAEAQADLIRSVYANAGLSPDNTGYFEAHGTGTAIGDPTELSAIGAALGQLRSPDNAPLYIGSVKSSIGHTEGTAGIAGVLKAIWCLERGVIVPNAGFEQLNSKIRLEEWGLSLPTKVMPWPTDGTRRISINSFGFGGSNAHVIIDDALHYLHNRDLPGKHQTSLHKEPGPDSGFSSTRGSPQPRSKMIFSFSSHDQQGLTRLSTSYAGFLEKKIGAQDKAFLDDSWLQSLAYTLTSRRSVFDSRSFVVANTAQSLLTQLSKGLPKYQRASKNQAVIGIFTGQGAQWPGMGASLLTNTVFRASMERTNTCLGAAGCRWSILDMISSADKRVNQPEYSQPLCTALQIALVDLFAYWGTQFTAVVGHSSGEIGAAYAAGFLSHEDAMRIAYLRGVFSADVNRRVGHQNGSMMAVGMSKEEAMPYIEQVRPDSVVVACVNSPSSITLSGDDDVLNELESSLKEDGKFARKLRTGTAYHSHHMRVIAQDYAESLSSIKPQQSESSSTLMFSSVTKQILAWKDVNAAYWVSNLINPVQFSDAVKTLLTHSVSGARRKRTIPWTAVVEIGPHEALKGPFNQIVSTVDDRLASKLLYTTPVLRGQDSEACAMSAAGQLWSTGHSVCLNRVNGHDDKDDLVPLEDLPPYPWNHSRGFWHEPKLSTDIRLGQEPRTDLLGVPVEHQVPFAPRWRNFLRITENPWIEDHKITGTTLYPGAGMLIMAIEAASQLSDKSKELKGFELRDVTFDRGLVVPTGDEAVETLLTFVAHPSIRYCYSWIVSSRSPSGDWIQHSQGLISIIYEDYGAETNAKGITWDTFREEYKTIKRHAVNQIDTASFYKNLQNVGMEYGPLFANIVSARKASASGIASGAVKIPDTVSSMPNEFEFAHLIHPATLDAIFHMLFVGFHGDLDMAEAAVPVNMQRLFLAAQLPSGTGNKFHVGMKTTQKSSLEQSGSLFVTDKDENDCKIFVENLKVRQVSGNDESSAQGLHQGAHCAQIFWLPDVDFLNITNGDKILQRLPLQTQYFGSPDNYFRLLCHKHANLDVLFICKHMPSQAFVRTLQRFDPSSAQQPRFKSCKLSIMSEELSCEVASAMGETASTISIEDFTLSSNEDDALDYDLIIADVSPTATSEYQDLDTFAKRRLRSSGTLMFRSNQNLSSDAWLSSRNSTSLSPVCSLGCIEGENCALAAFPRSEISNPVYKQIILLHASDISAELGAFEQQLKNKLIENGCLVEMATLSDDITLEERAVISLLEAEKPFTATWAEAEFEAFQRLVSSAEYILWVTAQADTVDQNSLDFATTTGLLRTMRLEFPQLKMPQLDLAGFQRRNQQQAANITTQTLLQTSKDNLAWNETEFRVNDGVVYIPRVYDDVSLNNELNIHSHRPLPQLSALSMEERPLSLKLDQPLAAGRYFFEQTGNHTGSLKPEDVELQITHINLSAKDLSDTSAKADRLPRREAVGVVTGVGKRVTTCVPGQQAFVVYEGLPQTVVRLSEQCVLPASRDFDTSDNLSSFVLYAQAVYLLEEVLAIHANQRLLVDAPSSPIGQAIIHVGRCAKAKVFRVASSLQERHALINDGNIAAEDVVYLRSTFFEDECSACTNQHGFDAIFSFSKGGHLRQLSSVLGSGGQFVNLDRSFDITSLAPGMLQSNASLKSVDLAGLSQTTLKPYLDRSMEMIHGDSLPCISGVGKFSVAHLTEAMDLVQENLATNNAIIEFANGAIVPTMPAPPISLSLDSSASYVLSGGLGALGLSIALYMVEHGARHLIFLSRSGASTIAQQEALAALQAKDCRVDALKVDVNDSSSMEQFVKTCNDNGWKVRGVIQAAMVMRDNVFENMSYEKWRMVIDPKTVGTRNLHEYLPKDMTFFVILSSIISVIGNTSQANYGAGNSFQDAFARYRNDVLGLSTTSLNVGLVSDASHFTSEYTIEDYLAQYGHMAAVQITKQELNVVLAAAMRGNTADGRKVPAQIIPGINNVLQRSGAVTSLWPMDRKFDHRIADVANTENTSTVSAQASLMSAISLTEATKVVEQALRSSVAASITAEPEDIDVEKPLSSYGVDSLKAVEVRNWLYRELKCNVSVFDVLSPLPLETFAAKIAGKSKLVSAEIAKEAEAIT